MKSTNIVQIVKDRNIVVPMYIYKLFPKLNIDLETFMFLMYLYNLGEKIIFNPNDLSQGFGISLEKVLTYIDKLMNNKLINFEIIKNEKNVSEEYLSLSFFYEKISMLLIEDSNKAQEDSIDVTIFDIIEKEFGRVLSPIEYEIIKAWTESNISKELIIEALKESVFNGVTNLRYIDKILYEWQKKGIRTKDDVEKTRKKFKEEKEKKIEVFEYNWLEDDE